MKKFVAIYVLLLGYGIKAQLPFVQTLNDYTCIDSTTIEMCYEFKWKNHHTNKEYNEDIRLVQIGKKVIKDFSKTIFYYDSLATENFKRGKDTYSIPEGPCPCELIIGTKERNIDIKYRLAMDIGTLCYQTKLPNLVWDYSSDEVINISGYNCNKATSVFGGREYVAWYTLDVPVHYGPYKFTGLPGLIIKIEEKTGMYIWNLLSISPKKENINVYRYNNEQKCDEKKADKIITEMMANPYAFMVANSDILIYMPTKDGKIVPVPKEGIEQAYEPIEIE